MHSCMYTITQTLSHAYSSTCMHCHVHIPTCILSCIHSHTHTLTHSNTHALTHTHSHTHTHTHTHTHAYTLTYSCMRTLTHTHSHAHTYTFWHVNYHTYTLTGLYSHQDKWTQSLHSIHWPLYKWVPLSACSSLQQSLDATCPHKMAVNKHAHSNTVKGVTNTKKLAHMQCQTLDWLHETVWNSTNPFTGHQNIIICRGRRSWK